VTAVPLVPLRATGDGDECEGALLGEWACSTLNDIPGVNWLYGRIGDAQRQKVEATTEALGGIVPDNFIEEWVTGMAESTVGLLAYIQALGEKVTAPAFDQRWWTSQYATSFGLSLLLLALLLVWISARFAAAGSSATAIDLFRQSGWRLVFVVPLISAGPVVLLHLQLAAGELAHVFAEDGRQHAGSAVERLMDLIVAKAGDWGVFGGTVLALLLFLFILCLGLVTLIEMAIAQWGLHLAALLVPLALVAWVHPPWSGTLRRLAALLGGLMLLPAFVHFFFTTIWSAFDSLLAGDDGDDGLSVLLFLAVGLLMIDAFPLVAMWLMTLTAGPGTGLDPQLRGVVQHPSGGALAASVVERFEARAGRIGTAEPVADEQQDADAWGTPPPRHDSGGLADAAGTAAAATTGGTTAISQVVRHRTGGDGEPATHDGSGPDPSGPDPSGPGHAPPAPDPAGGGPQAPGLIRTEGNPHVPVTPQATTGEEPHQ
jgi:hypothetical protein